MTVNVLEDELLRSGMKEFSQWPTFPQVYIDGEFFGGADIMIGGGVGGAAGGAGCGLKGACAALVVHCWAGGRAGMRQGGEVGLAQPCFPALHYGS